MRAGPGGRDSSRGAALPKTPSVLPKTPCDSVAVDAKNALHTSQAHPLVDGIENLAAGRLTVGDGFGVGVEAATADLAQVGLGTVFGLAILDRLYALTARALWHPTITSPWDSHYPFSYSGCRKLGLAVVTELWVICVLAHSRGFDIAFALRMGFEGTHFQRSRHQTLVKALVTLPF